MHDPAVVREYAQLAPGYDDRWSYYINATTRETLLRMPVAAGHRILDIGCGTGALLATLAARPVTLQLYGLDPVPQMLAIARKRLPATVKLEAGWAEALPFADASLDTVVTCSVFHFIREPEKALAEIGRVLVPGGSLVITDWCRDFPGTWLTDRYLSVCNAAHFHTYAMHELESLLARTGFTAITGDRYKIDWWWGMLTIRAGNPESP